ncbi:MAG: hypothetical protein JO042_14335, partial [Sinobacteraceae bacterium]|nr:hypothetical protein [Nevskiaceae bacterium]
KNAGSQRALQALGAARGEIVMMYTALLWGMLIDRVIWGVFPTSRVYIGGGIVIASGLYLIWRKHRSSAPPIAAETAINTTQP